MPNFRPTLRRISKVTIERMARVFGAVIGEYKFAESGTIVEDVVCLPFGENVKNRVSGASVVDRVESFIIPVTDTWPGTNKPQPYDLITFEGVKGWVDKANFDNLNSRWKVVLKYREGI